MSLGFWTDLADNEEDADEGDGKEVTIHDFHLALLEIKVNHSESSLAAVMQVRLYQLLTFMYRLLNFMYQLLTRRLAAVMQELDVDQDGGLSLLELVARVTSYRRRRRTFVAKALNRCFYYMRKTGQSATRLHFGMGANDVADRVQVLWPGGGATTAEDVEGRRVLRAVHPDAEGEGR